MDISETSFNTIEKSSLLEDYTVNLNNNVDLSSIDLTGPTSNAQSYNLSITLETTEQEMLLNEPSIKANNDGASINDDTSMHEYTENDGIMMVDESEVVGEITNGDGPEQSTLQNDTENVTESNHELAHNIRHSQTNGHAVSQLDKEPIPTIKDDGEDESAFFQNSFIELGRRLWKSTTETQHYTKGCLWSPDGTCILVPVHLDGMHVIELPSDLYTPHSISNKRPLNSLTSAVHVKEGGTVYDYVWYPFMNSTAPETCCWLATRQHEPIHMWDAFTGELRCSYRGYDDVDEVESAISIIFSNDGQKVMGGYKKSIKIFDTNIPGRDYSSVPVKQAISCFAFNTDNEQSVTVGSWNGYIQYYDLRSPKLGPLFTLGGHSGGITWLRYTASADGNLTLLSGARKDNKILQWDMRNYTQPVRQFTRNVNTNQRIYFDLSPLQQWLVSGDTEGLLRIWDLHDESTEIKVPLHSDCCNGVNFHPTQPILATSSGQYHFVEVTTDEEQNKQEKEVERRIVDYENSLLLLWFGESHTSEDNFNT